MLTTGLLLWAQVHRIGILASWPGPAKGQPLVGSNLITQATTRKGAARCVRPKSCSWEAAFASSFIYSGAKAAFHRAKHTVPLAGVPLSHVPNLNDRQTSPNEFLTN